MDLRQDWGIEGTGAGTHGLVASWASSQSGGSLREVPRGAEKQEIALLGASGALPRLSRVTS